MHVATVISLMTYKNRNYLTKQGGRGLESVQSRLSNMFKRHETKKKKSDVIRQAVSRANKGLGGPSVTRSDRRFKD